MLAFEWVSVERNLPRIMYYKRCYFTFWRPTGKWVTVIVTLENSYLQPTWVCAVLGDCCEVFCAEDVIISLNCWRRPSNPKPISFCTESCTEARTSDNRRENISSRKLWRIQNKDSYITSIGYAEVKIYSSLFQNH